MKSEGYLYRKILDYDAIEEAFREVVKNTKNPEKRESYRENKGIIVSNVYNKLKSRDYIPNEGRKFYCYEPKKRLIVAQDVEDKIIDHLVSRKILYPLIMKSLVDTNFSTRKGLGTSAAVKYFVNANRVCKIKYGKYYVLKCDISKYFASINHVIVYEMICKRIKKGDVDTRNILRNIIFNQDEGLNIGSMTSQTLALFYLNEMDHLIYEKLKVDFYMRYQDDFILFSPSKEHLQYCLKEIEKYLETIKLKLNNKTQILSSNGNFTFLGVDKKGNYTRYRRVKRKVRRKLKMFLNNEINADSVMSTIGCYECLLNNRTDIKKYTRDKLKDLRAKQIKLNKTIK